MNAQQTREFIRAGNATGTLVNHSTGNRYTFKFSCPKEKSEHRPIWVRVLIGPDNEHDYKFLGTIWPNDPGGWHVTLGGNSYWRRGDQIVDVVDWFLYRLTVKRGFPEGVEFKHAGKCGKCGHTLTTPESIERGLGPICAEKQ